MMKCAFVLNVYMSVCTAELWYVYRYCSEYAQRSPWTISVMYATEIYLGQIVFQTAVIILE